MTGHPATGSAMTCSAARALVRPAPTRSAGVRVWWLGQAGFAVEHDGQRLLIDPYLSDSLARKYEGRLFPHVRLHASPVEAAEIEGIDAVLHTHAHTDHLDPDTILDLQVRNNPIFVAPRAKREVAVERFIPPARLVALSAGDTIQITDGISVTAVPAAHEARERDDNGDDIFLGYVMDVGGTRLYHSGDCVPYEGQAELLRELRIDVALLPVNGRDRYRLSNGVPGNFRLAEAVDLCRAAAIPRLIVHHFGLFDFNTVDPVEVSAELSSIAGDLQWTVPEVGSEYTIQPPSGIEDR